MSDPAWSHALDLIAPSVLPVMLICIRLLPVSILCPLFGGAAMPAPARVCLALSLGGFFHLAGAIGTSAPVELTGQKVVVAVARELVIGLCIGWLASLPFDTARMAGRFSDLFRGSTAEAALPQAASREAAMGDFLFQLMLALANAAGMTFALAEALGRSFLLAPLGRTALGEDAGRLAAQALGGAMATGLSLAAPVALVGWGIDAWAGIAQRAFPQLQNARIENGLRLLLGALLLWALLPWMTELLMRQSGEALGAVLEVVSARG